VIWIFLSVVLILFVLDAGFRKWISIITGVAIGALIVAMLVSSC
jgi:hypothetical protein